MLKNNYETCSDEEFDSEEFDSEEFDSEELDSEELDSEELDNVLELPSNFKLYNLKLISNNI